MKYEILLKLIDKVDYFWNFLYITTGTVWVFLVGNNCQLQVYQKIIFTVVYVALMLFNYKAHIRGYIFLESFVEEVNEEIKKDFNSKKIQSLIKRLSYRRQRIVCGIIYVGLSVITLSLIWM